MPTQKQWTLARRPAEGLPTDGDFRFADAPIPEPGPGQLLSRTIYLSLDPYQWGRRRSGVEAVGEVCHGRTVSQVVRSNVPEYRERDFLFNTNGWQEYGLTGEGVSTFGYMYPRKIDPAIAPISTAVGTMGMLGLTAYAGIVLQCGVRAGETVCVSAASGGVGQIVGQIAKVRGCRVVGIAGTREKCDYVTGGLGFDACVVHRGATFPDDLRAACPEGIDAYFENVGGAVFDAVVPLLNRGARISLCGLVSQYGAPDAANARQAWGERGAATFERQQVAVHDLAVGKFVDDHQAAFLEQMAAWVKAGQVKYREDAWPGLENAPKAFRAMLEGGNFGKTLVAVSPDPTR